MKKHFWKIWLRLNPLTPDVDNDYVGEISTVGHTLRNENVAAQIVKERSELRYDTILSILNERDLVVRDTLLAGSSFQDSNFRVSPHVIGKWMGSHPVHDPEQQKPVAEATMTVEMRKALDEVGFEILGVKADGGAGIGLVTDVATGAIDGTITPDDDIIITGDKIKIDGEEGDHTGVFFVAADGTETPVTHRLTQNDPSKVVARVPVLAAGAYTLKIVTRFTGGRALLNLPRALTYELPLNVL